ncbi:type IV secretion system protein VirB7 [Brucella vulpis]|uniref:lipoprotein n=1 Tax=Brucella vulpis TaxID=981386 RepID=UPI00073ACA2D|nr:type IV secretion system protein VirB7 [Brucella vulpis]CUW51737.1 type IV secretion system protein VirB7 [Brucella vulpis]
MKKVILAFVATAFLAGCTTTGPAVVPVLDGKPRVPVNKSVPAKPPLAQLNPVDTYED